MAKGKHKGGFKVKGTSMHTKKSKKRVSRKRRGGKKGRK